MKKAIIIIVMSLIILLISACENQITPVNDNSDVVSDLSFVSDENLTNQNFETKNLLWKSISRNDAGVVTNTKTYKYDNLGRVSVLSSLNSSGATSTYYSYDEFGYLCKEEMRHSNSGSFISCMTYENNKDGKVLKTTSLDKNGKTLTEYINAYDQDGKIISESINNQVVKEYEYFEDGSYIVTFTDQDGYSKYDANGNILLTVDGDYITNYHYSDGMLSEVITTSDGSEYRTEYEYKDGLIYKQTNYDNGEITLIYQYEYNDKKQLISVTMQNGLGITLDITEHEYKDFEIVE